LRIVIVVIFKFFLIISFEGVNQQIGETLILKTMSWSVAIWLLYNSEAADKKQRIQFVNNKGLTYFLC